VDWIAVDLDWLERYGVAFRRDRYFLRRSVAQLEELSGYSAERIDDGVVLLQRGGLLVPKEQARLQRELERLRGIGWLNMDAD